MATIISISFYNCYLRSIFIISISCRKYSFDQISSSFVFLINGNTSDFT